MQHPTAIHWSQAQQVRDEQAERQQEKINEFLESNCELFTVADLKYYADTTGKGFDWVIENGKNINPVITHAVSMGVSLDDLSGF